MKKDFAIIFYEHAERELPFAGILSRQLEKNLNIKSLILQINSDQKFLSELDPKIIFLPFLYERNDPITSAIVDKFKNTLVINLMWEQIFIKSKVMSKIPEKFSSNIHHLIWSESWMEICKRNGLEGKVLHQIGHPIFSNLTGAMQRKRTMYPRILYVENSAILFATTTKKNKIENLTRKIEADYKRYFISNLEVLNKLREKYDVSIKVRPSTTISDFFTLVTNYIPNNRVVFKKNIPIGSLIHDYDLCLTDMSTSALEIAIRGVPVGILQQSKIPTFFRYDWMEFFEPFEENHVEKIEIKNFSVKNDFQAWLQKERFINPDYFIDLIELVRNNLKIKPSRGLNFSVKIKVASWQFTNHFYVFRNLRVITKKFKLNLGTHENDFPTSPYRYAIKHGKNI